MPARRTTALAGVERLEERRQVGYDVLHVHLDAGDARPAARAVPLEGVVHLARAHLLDHQADRARRRLGRVPEVARNEQDLALVDRDVARPAIFYRLEHDVAP